MKRIEYITKIRRIFDEIVDQFPTIAPSDRISILNAIILGLLSKETIED